MKKTACKYTASFLTGILLGFSFCVHAESATDFSFHIPRDGDRLHPNVSLNETAKANIDSEKRLVSIVPDLFAPLDAADISVFVNSDTISYIQNATKYLFRLSSDSLLYIGFENRASFFRLDNPVTVMTSVTGGTAGTENIWSGRLMHHGGELLKMACGVSSTTVEKGWTLAADMDTIGNVTKASWDFILSYVDTSLTCNGGVGEAEADSIPIGSISDVGLPIERVLSERLLSCREMWFTADARYPVFQQSRVFRLVDDGSGACDTIPISTFSQFYPTDFQYSDTGEIPDINRSRQNTSMSYSRGYGVTDTWAYDSIICDARYSGAGIEVTLADDAGDCKMTLTLFTDSGLRISEPVTVKAGAIPQKHSIPVPKDTRGVVIIVIESESGTYSRKVII